MPRARASIRLACGSARRRVLQQESGKPTSEIHKVDNFLSKITPDSFPDPLWFFVVLLLKWAVAVTGSTAGRCRPLAGAPNPRPIRPTSAADGTNPVPRITYVHHPTGLVHCHSNPAGVQYLYHVYREKRVFFRRTNAHAQNKTHPSTEQIWPAYFKRLLLPLHWRGRTLRLLCSTFRSTFRNQAQRSHTTWPIAWRDKPEAYSSAAR